MLTACKYFYSMMNTFLAGPSREGEEGDVSPQIRTFLRMSGVRGFNKIRLILTLECGALYLPLGSGISPYDLGRR